MSDEYPKTPLPKDVFRIPIKGEALADGIEKEFLKRRMQIAGAETFVKRNLAGKIVDKLPGPIGKAVAAGALAGVALEKGINKLKSKKGEDAKPEIPSGEEVQGKSKGGYVKKPYRMHSGKF